MIEMFCESKRVCTNFQCYQICGLCNPLYKTICSINCIMVVIIHLQYFGGLVIRSQMVCLVLHNALLDFLCTVAVHVDTGM